MCFFTCPVLFSFFLFLFFVRRVVWGAVCRWESRSWEVGKGEVRLKGRGEGGDGLLLLRLLPLLVLLYIFIAMPREDLRATLHYQHQCDKNKEQKNSTKQTQETNKQNKTKIRQKERTKKTSNVNAYINTQAFHTELPTI